MLLSSSPEISPGSSPLTTAPIPAALTSGEQQDDQSGSGEAPGSQPHHHRANLLFTWKQRGTGKALHFGVRAEPSAFLPQRGSG